MSVRLFSHRCLFVAERGENAGLLLKRRSPSRFVLIFLCVYGTYLCLLGFSAIDVWLWRKGKQYWHFKASFTIRCRGLLMSVRLISHRCLFVYGENMLAFFIKASITIRFITGVSYVCGAYLCMLGLSMSVRLVRFRCLSCVGKGIVCDPLLKRRSPITGCFCL